MTRLAKALLLAGLITIGIFSVIFWLIPIIVFLIITIIVYVVLEDKSAPKRDIERS